MRETVRNIMTKDPSCCSPDTGLQEVAHMMVEKDCGCIPIVDSSTRAPIGIITDRDITCRVVANGKNPLNMTVRDCMTEDCVTISEDAEIKECLRLMEEHRIRRILVVDSLGKCCGIIAQADIARLGDKKKTAEVVQEVSQPAAV
jgi:CBS domain-containing protein